MNNTNVINTLNIKEVLIENAMPFSCYTITERALPRIEDGLKPSHRRILYSMYLEGLTYNKKRTKSNNVSGLVMAYHPHGDTYPTLARLCRADSMNLPLADGKGNFGIHNMKEASESAPRYTEVRLSQISSEFFKGMNKNVVPMVDNFDETKKEPVVLPVSFPAILCNTTIGIAVGFTSNIAPYNFTDVCLNTAKAMRKEELDILIPDFATKGYILNDTDTFRKLHTEGKGTIRQRAKYKVENNQIIIYELPYLSTIEKIEEQVIDLIKSGQIKEITDINNYTDKNGINLTIDIKKNTNIDLLMNKLFKSTQLQNTFSGNYTVIYNNRPVTLGVKDIIEKWCEFRIEVFKKTLNYDIAELNKELNLLYGLEKIVIDLNKVIEIIKNTESEDDEVIIKNLMEAFDLNKIQAEYIANLRLKYLNRNNILKQLERLKKLENQLKENTDLLNNEKEIREVLAKQLEKLAVDFKQERYCELIEDEKIEVKEVIDDYNVQVVYTRDGYLKKIPLTSLRGSSTNRLKDGDEIIQTFNSTNASELLIFTDKLNCYKLWLHQIEDSKPSVLGNYLYSVLDLEKDEKIMLVAPVSYRENEQLVLSFSSGRMVRIPTISYQTKNNRTKLLNAIHSNDLIYLDIITEPKDYLTMSNGRILIFNSEDISMKTSKNTQGVIMQKHIGINVVLCKPLADANIQECNIDIYRKGKNGTEIMLGDDI